MKVRNANTALLDVQDLKTYYFTYRGIVRAVDGVSMKVEKDDVVGLLGETGCGKSCTGLSIMGLIKEPGKVVSGKVYFDGEELLEKTEEEMDGIRGQEIAMIFQDPTTALNPVFNIGDQITETIVQHQKLDKSQAWAKMIKLLDDVGFASPSERVRNYPHQFSVGMRQRVMIAIALSCQPKLLIADEPTTALDVTVEAQILELLMRLRKDYGSSILIITHNLGVIAETCNKVFVMYAGKVVESADVRTLFKKHRHPYTAGLMNAIPKKEAPGRVKSLQEIRGTVPNMIDPPAGCRFHPRCDKAREICLEHEPTLVETEPEHFVACYMV